MSALVTHEFVPCSEALWFEMKKDSKSVRKVENLKKWRNDKSSWETGVALMHET